MTHERPSAAAPPDGASVERLCFEHLGLRALALGRGPTALVLHGFPDLPTSWVPLAARLADAGLRCVLPYMPGYPPSSTAGPFDADTLGDRVASLAAELADRVHLVGHDWGSAVAQSAVIRHPDRFARLVLLSVPHALTFLSNTLRSPRQLHRSRYMAFFQLPRLPERRIRDPDVIDALYRRWSLRPPPRTHVEEVAAALAAAEGAPLRYYRANLRPTPALLARLRRAQRTPIAAPTLYLHGADDGCIAAKIARGQERWFAGPFVSRVLPRAGHFLQLDAPQTLGDAVVAWLVQGSAPELGIGRGAGVDGAGT